MHWCCAVINFAKKRIEYYDSLLSKNPQCMQILRDYLDKEHKDKKGSPFDFSGWKDYTPTVSDPGTLVSRFSLFFVLSPATFLICSLVYFVGYSDTEKWL